MNVGDFSRQYTDDVHVGVPQVQSEDVATTTVVKDPTRLDQSYRLLGRGIRASSGQIYGQVYGWIFRRVRPLLDSLCLAVRITDAQAGEAARAAGMLTAMARMPVRSFTAPIFFRLTLTPCPIYISLVCCATSSGIGRADLVPAAGLAHSQRALGGLEWRLSPIVLSQQSTVRDVRLSSASTHGSI
jgi:hypothetical protein